MKNRFLLPRAYPLVDRPRVQCHCSFQELCRLGTQGPIVTILSFSITETNEVAVFFFSSITRRSTVARRSLTPSTPISEDRCKSGSRDEAGIFNT